MKLRLLLAFIFVLLALIATGHAQVSPQIQGAGAPTNPCYNGGQQYVDQTNHVIYGCPSSGSNWAALGLGNTQPTSIRSLASDPAACLTSDSNGTNNIYYNTTSSAFKYCSATNTWTAFVGAAVAAGTSGQPAYYTAANAIGTIGNSSFSQVIDVETMAGATNDVKWQNCWALLSGYGGICDDSRYTNTANNITNWVTDPFWNHTTNTSYMPKGAVAILGQGLYNTAEPIIQGASDTKVLCSGSQRGTQVATSGCIIRMTGVSAFGTKVFSTGTVNISAGNPTVTANGGQDWSTVFGTDPTGWYFLVNTSGTPCGGAGQYCVVYGMVTGFTAGANGTLTLDRDAQSAVATGTYTLTPPLYSQGFEGSNLFGVQTLGVGLDCNSFQTYPGGVGFERIAAEEDSYWKGGTASNCSGTSYYVASSKAQNSGPDQDLEFLSPSTQRPQFYTVGGIIGGKTQSSSGGEMTQWSGIGNLTINFQQNATPASKADGTVATTYGSKVITGVGTLFSTNQQIGWWFATAQNASNQMCFGQIISIASDTSATLDRPCQATMVGGTTYTVRGCSAATTACAAAGGGYFPATGLMINSRGGIYGGGLGRIHTERLGVGFWVGNNYTSTGGLTIDNISACNSASACGGTINGANAVVEIGTGSTDVNVFNVVPVSTTNDVVDNNQGPQGQASQSTFVTSAVTTVLDHYSIDKNNVGKWARTSTSSEASTEVPTVQSGPGTLVSDAAGTIPMTLAPGAGITQTADLLDIYTDSAKTVLGIQVLAGGALINKAHPIGGVGVDSGSGTAYVVAGGPINSLEVGAIECFTPANANTGTTPTVAFNGLTAKTIVKLTGAAVAVGDLATTQPACVVYNGSNMYLLNPQTVTGAGKTVLQNNPTFSNGFTASGTVTGSNTVRLTADGTGITATTPGTTFLTLPTLVASSNYSFTCEILYSQATAAVLDGFSIQAATNAATRWDAWGTMDTTNPASTTVTASKGSVLNVTTTTSTPVVSATPGATATVFQARLAGSIQVGASVPTVNIAAFTGNASDAVTIKAGSFCSVHL